ncbi:MAG: HAMP domain-containing sensor histidine kinase [Sphingomonas sp.]
MRLVPRSIRGRMLALSTLATALALAVAAFGIGHVLERFVMQGLDQQLDAELALLASTVRGDGTIDRARIATMRGLADRGPDWRWRIAAPRETLGSADFPDLNAPPPPPGPRGAPPPAPRDAGEYRPRALDTRGDGDHSLHARQLALDTPAGKVVLTAAAPRALIDRPIRAALAPLLAALLVLGVALALATLIQLRLGLRPLVRLRESIAAIRAGAARHLPPDQPAELAPLAAELNALIDQNAAQLAASRGHVANLAHGLKTPLAALALKLDPATDPDGALAAEIARIDAAIRHHLGRARADTSGGGAARRHTPLAAAIAGLSDALARIHADRGIVITVDVASDIALAIDPQDLDELLGNLLDNAWRWARSTIRVSAARDGAAVRIAIADDGPGIPAAARAAALQPGRRLDESGDGHGFGLSIARELLELHGGALALDATPGGGLTAIVTLPRVIPAADMA